MKKYQVYRYEENAPYKKRIVAKNLSKKKAHDKARSNFKYGDYYYQEMPKLSRKKYSYVTLDSGRRVRIKKGQYISYEPSSSGLDNDVGLSQNRIKRYKASGSKKKLRSIS